MAIRFHLPSATFGDNNNDPLSGGLLYMYEAGTTTALDTYSDEDLTTANANPVIADSSGRFGDIWLKEQAYKVVLKDSDGVTITTMDPVNGNLAVSGDEFKVSPQDPADMTVSVGAGTLFNVVSKAIVTKVAQTSATIAAPVGNPRWDIIHIDRLTGVIGIDTGTPAESPADPTISDDKLPLARVKLATTTTEITGSLITDIRELVNIGSGAAITKTLGVADGNIPAMDATGYPAADGSQITDLAWANIADAKMQVYDFIDTSDVSIASVTPTGTLWSSSQSITIPTSGLIMLVPYGRIDNASGGDKLYSIGLRVNATDYFAGADANGTPTYVDSTTIATGGYFTMKGSYADGSNRGGTMVLDIEGLSIETGSQTVRPVIGTDNSTATQTLKGTTITARLKVIIFDFS